RSNFLQCLVNPIKNASPKVAGLSLKAEHSNDDTVPLFRRLVLASSAIPVGVGSPNLRDGGVCLGRPRTPVGRSVVLSRAGGRLLLRLAGAEGNARVKPNSDFSSVQSSRSSAAQGWSIGRKR